MRARAVFPGALLAAALTGTALLALMLALAIRGNGPLPLGLGDSGGAAQLSEGQSGSPAGGGERAPITLPLAAPASSVAASSSTGAAARRHATAPAATTQGRHVALRPALRTPRRSATVAPAPTVAPRSTVSPTKPVATSTPAPPAVKVRSHAKPDTTRTQVPKSRVKPAPSVAVPTPGSAPAPAPRIGEAPPVDKQRVEPPSPADNAPGEPVRVPGCS